MRKPLIIARQGRRPAGLLGEVVARIMAKETAAENGVALDLLRIGEENEVLEIGCGHGETLARAARAVPSATLTGIDFSWLMHRHAIRRHRRLVDEGRIAFRFGSSDDLPFADAAFDRALSVHTVYFWTAPLDHLHEVRRVLKPDGRLVLGFRPAEDARVRATFPPEVYCIRPEAEVAELIREAGFEVLETVRREVGPRLMSFIAAAPAQLPRG